MQHEKAGKHHIQSKVVVRLDDQGKWIRKVIEPNGTERPLTKAEAEQADRARREDFLKQGLKIHEFMEAVAYDPDYGPPWTDRRYQQYVLWKKGLNPHYGSTMVDRNMLTAESIRETYGPHKSSAAPSRHNSITAERIGRYEDARKSASNKRATPELPVSVGHGSDPSSNESNPAQPSHSPDFTSVNWFGIRYNFAKGLQACSVRELWKAWERGGLGLAQETIGNSAGSQNDRFSMAKVFRQKKPGGGYTQHPAWGEMIQQVSKGCYGLVGPKST